MEIRKILYIDMFSSTGHVNFNKIYINGLIDKGFNVRLILKDNYIKELSLSSTLVELSIPNHYFVDYNNRIINRLQLLKILWYIKTKLDFSNYDLIIFSGYEEISLFLSNIKQKLVLINHNNISGLNSRIKRYFFKLISKNNIHIVFEQYIKKYLNNIGIKNVIAIPHGLPIPFPFNSFEEEIAVDTVLSTTDFKQYKKIIFSPSGSSIDYLFISKLICNKQFILFLKANEILLIIKGNFEPIETNNIVIIDYYLTEIQYRSLFMMSNAILISYPKTHKYRVSAVLFESISNNKICFLSEIEAFRNYEDHFNYNPFYKNIDELILNMRNWLLLDAITLSNPFSNKEILMPNFNCVINELN